MAHQCPAQEYALNSEVREIPSILGGVASWFLTLHRNAHFSLDVSIKLHDNEQPFLVFLRARVAAACFDALRMGDGE